MKTPGCVYVTGRFLWVDHLPAGVSVGGKARYRLGLCRALFTEIGLINGIVLIDHKAHHAGFPHATGHASKATLCSSLPVIMRKR